MNSRLDSGMTLALQSAGDGAGADAPVRDVTVRWSQLPTERLLIGQRVGPAEALVPAALALCHQAHCAAAQRALDAAQGLPSDADAAQARDERVRLEAGRETLRRWLIDFPAAFGEAWPPGTLTQWPRLTTQAALAGFCAQHVFGLGPAGAAHWLALDEPGQRDWAERGLSLPAHWLRALLQDADRPAAVAPADVIGYARQHAAQLIAGAPVAQDAAPLHADLWDAPATLPDLASGLLIARLRHLARLCGAEQGAHPAAPATSGGERVSGTDNGDDIGIGWARTARGLLVHLARVERSTVAAYRIIAPTYWNFGAPSALLRQALAGRAREDAQRRFGRLVLLLDPCVPFELEAGTVSYA